MEFLPSLLRRIFAGKSMVTSGGVMKCRAVFSGYSFRFAWLIKLRKAKGSNHVRERLGTAKTRTDLRLRHACKYPLDYL